MSVLYDQADHYKGGIISLLADSHYLPQFGLLELKLCRRHCVESWFIIGRNDYYIVFDLPFLPHATQAFMPLQRSSLSRPLRQSPCAVYKAGCFQLSSLCLTSRSGQMSRASAFHSWRSRILKVAGLNLDLAYSNPG